MKERLRHSVTEKTKFLVLIFKIFLCASVPLW